MPVRQKVPKLYFQSQFFMSKIDKKILKKKFKKSKRRPDTN